jgi:hypothetical protein
MMHDAYMRESGEPTWRLVMLAAQRLDALSSEFRMQDLVAEVQRMDPARGAAPSSPSSRTFTGLAQVARAVKPADYIGEGWRTSRSKVLDNAIIGYCKLNQITPVRT